MDNFKKKCLSALLTTAFATIILSGCGPVHENDPVSATESHAPSEVHTPAPSVVPTTLPTPASAPVTPSQEPAIEVTYILNTNSMKFHYPSCSGVDQMKESNKRAYTGDRDEIISQGYSPCKRCCP